MSLLVGIVHDSLLITGFVFVMMLLVEYVNVLTDGLWQRVLQRGRWRQYVIAVILGVTPGCLGVFAVVAMFTHRVLGFGALVAAMIATSGDEAFVMFATMPETAVLLAGIMMILGLIVGPITDQILKHSGAGVAHCDDLTIHASERCECFSGELIAQQWKELSLSRAALSLLLLTFLAGVLLGWIGPEQWDWMRTTILLSVLAAGFVVATVPEHFLQSHLWEHVARKHAMRILIWTCAALLVTQVLTERLDLTALLSSNPMVPLVIASLVGIIPESGPHLVFVTLYAKGAIPIGVLLANSIVQDGHGTLPLLGHSRKVFFLVKAINLVAGMLAGSIAVLGDW